MVAGEAILVRTHYFDDALQEFCSQLRNGTEREIFVVCDETKSPVTIPNNFTKISINTEILDSLGLYTPKNFGWLCGDYCYYIARSVAPSFSSYWLIEGDVRFKFDDVALFFSHFPSADAVDMLAAGFQKAVPSWLWYESMRSLAPEVYGCLFPVTRLSGRAVDFLAAERTRLATSFSGLAVDEKGSKAWPNDEAFVATTLMNSEFVCRDLNAFGATFYDKETFWVGRPASHQRIMQKPNDNMVYHPVIGGDRYLQKMKSSFNFQVSSRKSPEYLQGIFNSQMLQDIEMECGPAKAKEFAASCENQIRKLIRIRNENPA
ncbi:MAG TPA: hypothetical protein VNZ61_18900 [Roseomonas sp.]|nr:hypothetical protein [Roseomonas sp.]